jgi:ATP-dependent 26S proteasome regulatory subunit
LVKFNIFNSLDYPNFNDRVEILKQYLKYLPLEENFNFEKVVKNKLSGAEIENLCREVAIYSIKNNSNIIVKYFYNYKIEK